LRDVTAFKTVLKRGIKRESAAVSRPSKTTMFHTAPVAMSESVMKQIVKKSRLNDSLQSQTTLVSENSEKRTAVPPRERFFMAEIEGTLTQGTNKEVEL